MKYAALVMQGFSWSPNSFLSSAEGAKVLYCLWYIIFEQLKHYPAHWNKKEML